MPDILSPENLDDVAANILHSKTQDPSQFHALAQQVGPCKTTCFFTVPAQHGRQCSNVLLALQIVWKAMQSPEEAETWSESLATLLNVISEPGACGDSVTKPLGGSSGPGKALRSGHLFSCAMQHALCLALACG